MTTNWTVCVLGEFGKSQREVDILQFRSPRDPCDALLQDWASTVENSTVQVLKEKILKIGRMDVVRRIDDFVQGN